MITLTEIEKAFDKSQNPFVGGNKTTPLRKTGIKGNYLYFDKENL